MEQFLTQKVSNFVLYFAPILKRATNKKYAQDMSERLGMLLSCPLVVTLLGATITKTHESIETYIDSESKALGITLSDEERSKLLKYYTMFSDVAKRMEAQRPKPATQLSEVVIEDV